MTRRLGSQNSARPPCQLCVRRPARDLRPSDERDEELRTQVSVQATSQPWRIGLEGRRCRYCRAAAAGDWRSADGSSCRRTAWGRPAPATPALRTQVTGALPKNKSSQHGLAAPDWSADRRPGLRHREKPARCSAIETAQPSCAIVAGLGHARRPRPGPAVRRMSARRSAARGRRGELVSLRQPRAFPPSIPERAAPVRDQVNRRRDCPVTCSDLPGRQR